jgi:hypothetical protein
LPHRNLRSLLIFIVKARPSISLPKKPGVRKSL